ncbi:MAG: OmpA family protein [Candidatus Acidoferrales bacterium]|nr:OmpA family protein [Candidatus Acidoferrales bacterium]
MRRLGYLFTLVIALAMFATSGFAQDGKLKIKVTPKQAYVFVDGNAIREGNQSISLSPGKHTVVVVNYGYKISTQDVSIEAGKSTPLEVKLDSYGGTVAGPFGDVQFSGDERAAVLSNGATPAYFVGHVDEFNWDWIWHQNLLLPAGTHHLTVTHAGKTVWSGDVTVVVGKKVVVDLSKGTQKTVEWKRGESLKDVPRFKAGIASATVAVAPVTGSFSSSTANINCGQSSTLTWQTSETVDANISGIGTVAASGSQSVSPHATTTYDFTSAGPGGIVKGSSTVNVNTKVDASLTANPAEVHYRKIGEKVITQDSSTVTWTTSNADSVTVDGQKVELNGNETVKAEPADSSQVPDGGQPRTIDETKNFTLNATNVCGGSATQTAGMHITGSVEPIPAVTLQSVFYPTDYPDKKHPQIGLVRSQQLALATLAGGFKKYLEYDPDAKLSVEAHADDRGSKPFNQDLSERRVERIKQYLVDQGISADKVQTAAYGKDQPLDKATVGTLESTNPNAPPKARLRDKRSDWLAYNRRADIVLLPSGKKSAQFFPHSADDSKLIWQMPKPPLAKVQADQ